MSDQNKSIIRRQIDELWNEGNITASDELFAATYVNHDPVLPDVKDLEQFKQWAAHLRAMYPDLRVVQDDILAEGDKVAIRYTFSGTISDQFDEESVRGKSVKVTETNITRIANGKIQETWWNYDQLGANRQAGHDLA